MGASRFLERSAATLDERWPRLVDVLAATAQHQHTAALAGANAGFAEYRRLWDRTGTSAH